MYPSRPLQAWLLPPDLGRLVPPLKVPPWLVSPRPVLKGCFEQRKSNISFCPDVKRWAFIRLETDGSTNPSDQDFLIYRSEPEKKELQSLLFAIQQRSPCLRHTSRLSPTHPRALFLLPPCPGQQPQA